MNKNLKVKNNKTEYSRKKALIEEDKLGIKKQVLYISTMIKEIQNHKTLSISAQYGGGKTFFADCLEERLNQMQIQTIYVDLFKNDYKDPLTTILSEIIDKLSAIKDTHNFIKISTRLIQILNNNYIPKIPKKFIKAGTFGILGGISKKFMGIDIEKIFYFLTKKDEITINSFKKQLENLTKKEKLVILIDEIDRCNPKFAIETLEVIKHLFDIDNIIFVLFINPYYKSLLENQFVIKNNNSEYGISSGYMEKFIDKDIKIIHYFQDEDNLPDRDDSYKYYNLIKDKMSSIIDEQEICCISLILSSLNALNNSNIEIREILQIIEQVEEYIGYFVGKDRKIYNYNLIYIFLMYTIKIKFYNIYKEIRKNNNVQFLERLINQIDITKNSKYKKYYYEFSIALIKIFINAILNTTKYLDVNQNYDANRYSNPFIQNTYYGNHHKENIVLYVEEWFKKIDFI